MTRTRPHAMIGTITLLAVLVFTVGVMGGIIGPQMFSGGGSRTVTAVFANAQQLETGDEVHISGVIEGTVSSIQLAPGGRAAIVKMSMLGSAGPLYRNASAVVRWKTLLGSAFYVDLYRGSPSSGSLGSSEITEAHTSDQVELDDLLSVDNSGAKQGLKTMIPQLSEALSDPSSLSAALGALTQVAPSVAAGVGALRGEQATQDDDLKSLVSATATTLHALNAPDDQMQGLVQGAAATLGVTAARSQDIEAALSSAPAAIRQTDTTFSQLDQTLGIADPLLTKLEAPAAQVAPTFASLRPTLTGASSLLRKAVPLLDTLPPTMRSVASASQQGLPLLDSLTPSIDKLADDVLPYLNQVDPSTQHTTAEMIGPTLEALGPDIAGQEDQNGHFIRFPATAGSSPLYAMCNTYLGNPTATQLLACQSLSQALESFLDYNPLQSAEGGTPTQNVNATTVPSASRTPTGTAGGSTTGSKQAAPTTGAGSTQGGAGAANHLVGTVQSVTSGATALLKHVGSSIGGAVSGLLGGAKR